MLEILNLNWKSHSTQWENPSIFPCGVINKTIFFVHSVTRITLEMDGKSLWYDRQRRMSKKKGNQMCGF